MAIQLIQSNKYLEVINKHWIILDMLPTRSISNSIDMMDSTRPCTEGEILNIVKNGGAERYDTIRTFKLLPVEYH